MLDTQLIFNGDLGDHNHTPWVLSTVFADEVWVPLSKGHRPDLGYVGFLFVRLEAFSHFHS